MSLFCKVESCSTAQGPGCKRFVPGLDKTAELVTVPKYATTYWNVSMEQLTMPEADDLADERFKIKTQMGVVPIDCSDSEFVPTLRISRSPPLVAPSSVDLCGVGDNKRCMSAGEVDGILFRGRRPPPTCSHSDESEGLALIEKRLRECTPEKYQRLAQIFGQSVPLKDRSELRFGLR
eukprot:TRINITY_DN12882_c0_g1_i1.p1 TRINITY_DN12882_c0_g1~~TRINITY_DN12882_c0_g1_i1.p1  ORF type:complete len:178 (-),score=20.50 TRINITY_DN12882_c0_g1_i1:348-881(-)